MTRSLYIRLRVKDVQILYHENWFQQVYLQSSCSSELSSINPKYIIFYCDLYNTDYEIFQTRKIKSIKFTKCVWPLQAGWVGPERPSLSGARAASVLMPDDSQPLHRLPSSSCWHHIRTTDQSHIFSATYTSTQSVRSAHPLRQIKRWKENQVSVRSWKSKADPEALWQFHLQSGIKMCGHVVCRNSISNF